MSILYLIPIWFFLALLIPTIWSMSKAYKRTWDGES
jgi:Na+-transporting methylmalonyl-CoA/oxaloacetate decarboxylase gamma subunit